MPHTQIFDRNTKMFLKLFNINAEYVYMNEDQNINLGANIGGTIVAIFVSVTVLVFVSIVVAIIASFFNYYMSSMRIEAAAVIGGIIGGVAGAYAARMSCDAVIKSYSKRSVFIAFVALIGLATVYEFIEGVSWEALPRLAQWAATIFVSWVIFWKGEDV